MTISEQSSPPTEAQPQHLLDNDILNRMFLRSLSLEASYNYERQQALGFAFMMIPALQRLYSTPEARAVALKRHLEFFNTTPYVSQAIGGVAAATEEQLSLNSSSDPTTVASIKAALMGPLAGIGDSLYWGTIRLIFTGIGTSLAMSGSVFGPILFFLGFNVPVQTLSWIYMRQSYKLGTSFLSKISSGDGMRQLTYAAGILGLLVIGAMTASMVKIYLPISFKVGNGITEVQKILDDVMPGILALGAFWVIYWLLGRGWKATSILVFIFILGIVGTFLGILGLQPVT